MIPSYHLTHKFYNKNKTIKNLTLFSFQKKKKKKKIIKYFKILDHSTNSSKIDLSASPKSVFEFRTRVSATKIYLPLF